MTNFKLYLGVFIAGLIAYLISSFIDFTQYAPAYSPGGIDIAGAIVSGIILVIIYVILEKAGLRAV